MRARALAALLVGSVFVVACSDTSPSGSGEEVSAPDVGPGADARPRADSEADSEADSDSGVVADGADTDVVGPSPDADVVDVELSETLEDSWDGGEVDAGPELPDPVDACADEPCGPHGSCVELDPGPGFACECVTGWAGELCDACAPGYHLEGEGPGATCEADDTCSETSCSGNGVCSDAAGVVSCDCDEGWSGTACESCDEESGYHPDGEGGCTTDPCVPDPCTDDNEVCETVEGSASCVCAAGYHDEDGICVPDEGCLDSTCKGNGTCSDAGGVIVCTCDPGWTGDFCDACDEASGYHPDGLGGCTTDPCQPNPCDAPNKTICNAPDGATAVCACDAGFHDDGEGGCTDDPCTPNPCNGLNQTVCTAIDGAALCSCDPGYHEVIDLGCVEDETCGPDACSGVGLCLVEAGVTSCQCPAAYAGEDCEACADGYHDDGAGGCTDDPCLPDPCAADETCVGTGGVATCEPILCDDGNPCTSATVVDGGCVYVELDGQTCSTSACLEGEICVADTCSGGSATACDDGNPCTADSCDPATGCVHSPDDALVPDDGIDCTADSCLAGSALHTADDGLCAGSGSFCAGQQACTPGDPDAGADGCVVLSAPQPPTVDGPCGTWLCDDLGEGFVFELGTVGAVCDDGLACTSGDLCQPDGACRGDLIAGCSTLTQCEGTSPAPFPGVIDIPIARLQATITKGGAPLPDKSDLYAFGAFYLKAHDTGALHRIGDYDYESFYDPDLGYYIYQLTQDTIDTQVLTGVYDLVYRSSYSADSNIVQWNYPDEVMVRGNRVLQADVVIGPGLNTLAIDLPVATLTGQITKAGAPLPDKSNLYAYGAFYLKAQDTGALHRIGDYDYESFYDPDLGYYIYQLTQDTIDTQVIPGTYDLVYRSSYSADSNIAQWNYPDEVMIRGNRVLQPNVVITPGANVLDIDLPAATLTGQITKAGAPLPDTSTLYAYGAFYLQAHDTGALHRIGEYDYESFYDPDLGYYIYQLTQDTIDTQVIPGTYDLVYRSSYSADSNIAQWSYPDEVMIRGNRVLQANVVITPGANVLDIDLPAATLTGQITKAGAPLPDKSNLYAYGAFYLKAHDTGALHRIGEYDYESFYDPDLGYYIYQLTQDTIDTQVIPGTYDLVYRSSYSADSNIVQWSYPDEVMIRGNRVLQANVVISPGANVLDIDLPAATLSGQITKGGAPLPDKSNLYAYGAFYLKAQDTGALHRIGDYDYESFYDPDLGYYIYQLTQDAIDTQVIPGTYDLVYRSGYSADSNIVQWNYPDEVMVRGNRVLQANVVITPGANVLDIDLPAAAVAAEITQGGLPLPDKSNLYAYAAFYLQAHDTGALHRIGDYDYESFYDPDLGYYIYQLTQDTIDTQVLAGTYALLYSSSYSADSNIVQWNYPDQVMVRGRRILDRCLEVPPQ